MNTKVKQVEDMTAATYQATYGAVMDKLFRLQEAIQSHIELVNKTKVDWGMVGDLQRLNSELHEILEWME